MIQGLLLFVLLNFSILNGVFAADETLTMTTYYPSPKGAYKELMFYPNSANTVCNNGQEGKIYYNSTNHSLEICSSNGTGNFTWMKVGGTGSGASYWDKNNSTNDIFSTNSGNVAVGDNQAGMKFEVAAGMNNGLRLSHNTSGRPRVDLTLGGLGDGNVVIYDSNGNLAHVLRGNSAGWLGVSNNIGIGLNPNAGEIPLAKLHVKNGDAIFDKVVLNQDAGGSRTIQGAGLIEGAEASSGGGGISHYMNIFSPNSQSQLMIGRFDAAFPYAYIIANSAGSNSGIKFRTEISSGQWDRMTIEDNGLVQIHDVAPSEPAYPYTYRLLVAGGIYTTGTYQPSDERFKEDIQELDDVSWKIEKIRAVKYTSKADKFPDKGLSKKRQIGIIAQDVEKEFPELVSSDEDGYKIFSYDRFTAILLQAVKEQQKQIQELKREIEKLKSK